MCCRSSQRNRSGWRNSLSSLCRHLATLCFCRQCCRHVIRVRALQHEAQGEVETRRSGLQHCRPVPHVADCMQKPAQVRFGGALTAWLPTTNSASFSSFTGSTVSLITHRMSKLRGKGTDTKGAVDHWCRGSGVLGQGCWQHRRQLHGCNNQQDGGSVRGNTKSAASSAPHRDRMGSVSSTFSLNVLLASYRPPMGLAAAITEQRACGGTEGRKESAT